MATATERFNIKFEEAELTEQEGEEVLREFSKRLVKPGLFFKPVEVQVQYHEFFQTGNIKVDLDWRFWFSE